MLNFKQHARYLIAKWANEPFQFWFVQAEDEMTDEPDEDQTIEQKEIFDRDYAIFSLEFKHTGISTESPYSAEPIQDEHFWAELANYLQKEFGPDAYIKIFKPANEIEIIRK